MKFIVLSNSDKVVMVSDEDYYLVSRYTWRLKKSSRCSYVCTSIRTGKSVQTIRMHRMIMSPADWQDIHHIDQNPLNNLRENLECIDRHAHGGTTRFMNKGAKL